jgi:hypothetical protein
VRARYLIPAAVLVAAAYLKGRHDRLAAFPPPLPSVPVPPAPERAPASPDLVLADCEVVAAAEPPVAEAPVAAPAAPEPPVLTLDAAGRFSLEGWAALAGQMTVRGVSFPERLGREPAADEIRLIVDARANVADGGLVVLGDAGFAPDGEGFTLLLAAAAPGGFAASGRYELPSVAA